MIKVAVLISSFDGFSDCWEPVCHGINKYWSDCPFPIYLITNEKIYKHPKVIAIRLGKDMGWAENLMTVLNQVEEDYIIYFQEDYWIRERVNTETISHYISIMDSNKINYLRLLAHPAPDSDFAGDERIGVLATDAPYRTALQIAVWRKDVLRDLLIPGESPWQFEVAGSIRSQKYGDSFLSVKKFEDDPYYHGIQYVCTAINQGRWARAAKAYAEHEQLSVDWGNLPSETWWHEFTRDNRFGQLIALSVYRINLMIMNPKIAFVKAINRLFTLRQSWQ